ncbi:MAG: peptide chain release factor N(5)-glutamine methyltransferase [Rhodobacteraceae bacterium]|nr:peptide chain release factor N(5)-glutamine methyltransferase [Paracoccaceae bacterium]MCY4251471.1 peptide chain release factor N(5)-glutamine methyltransferase [Paracoccaceae bacterium]MCY4308843.1 peptide chain release factor N(5)-glutamine methyltransferase [Paracoccaceae bacterium]
MMESWSSDTLRSAALRLHQAGVENPGYDTTKLFESCLGKRIYSLNREEINAIPGKIWSSFENLISLREQRMPVAKIINEKEFWGRSFHVNTEVLDPRPDTEILIKEAISEEFGQFLDLGVGSGCLLVTLLAENPAAYGIGSDISSSCISVARMNIKRFGLKDRCKLITSDWFSEINCNFDLIISNPPYISKDEYETLQPEIRYFEPRIALTLEDDGLGSYRKIASEAGKYLNRGGRLIIEIGFGKYHQVKRIFERTNLSLENEIPDLCGITRVLVFRKV